MTSGVDRGVAEGGADLAFVLWVALSWLSLPVSEKSSKHKIQRMEYTAIPVKEKQVDSPCHESKQIRIQVNNLRVASSSHNILAGSVYLNIAFANELLYF